MPRSAEEAVELAQAGALAEVLAIKVRSVAGEKYDRIVDYELGAKPEPAYATAEEDEWDRRSPEPDYLPIPEDEVPF